MKVVMGNNNEALVSNLAPEIRDGFFSSNTYFITLDTDSSHNYLKRLAELTGETDT